MNAWFALFAGVSGELSFSRRITNGDIIPDGVTALRIDGDVLPAPATVLLLGIAGLAVPAPGGVDGTQPLDQATGLLVTEVTAASAADGAGLIPGDIVLAVNGAGGDANAIARRLRRVAAGRAVTIELLRGGRSHTIEVVAAAA